MSVVISDLSQIIAILSNLSSLVSSLQSLVNKAAKENIPFHIDNTVDIIEAQTGDSVFGLAAIQAQLATFQATTATDVTAILTAIAAVQQAANPVTLPSTAPPGYGGATASDVWNTTLPTRLKPAYQYLTLAGDFVSQLQSMLTPIAGSTFPWPWIVTGLWGEDTTGDPNPSEVFALDIGSILETDATAFDWVTRVYTAETWLLSNDGTPFIVSPTVDFQYEVYLPTLQWLQLKALLFGGSMSSLNLPPVWPGITNVTLGTPLALSDGLTVPGPLDGVLIEITSVPTPISYYPFGTLRSYVHAGGIAFVDDNGQAETTQSIGLAEGVVCPRFMVHADHAIIRLPSGVVGTVTPWTTP